MKMKTQWNWMVILTLLLGLLFAGPAQPVSAQASATANFTFTSSPNPSAHTQSVTFTLTATGTDPDLQPFGYVYFFDNDNPICGRGDLNMVWGHSYNPDIPVTCTISTLQPGMHVITAEFSSMVPSTYPDEIITLPGGQIVNEPYPLILSQDTLPDATYGMYYDQDLTAACQEGVSCGASIWWELISGNLPPGMSLFNSGSIEGQPQTIGSYTFTVKASDNAGSAGSREYTLTVVKATPEIGFSSIQIVGGTAYLTVYVIHPSTFWEFQPSGLVSLSVDDVPLPGCIDLGPIPNMGTRSFSCNTGGLANLAPGSHTIRADFTPDAASAIYFTNGSGTTSHTVLPRVEGLLFNDLDRDGTRDEGERPVSGQVGLDLGCDGAIDSGAYVYDDSGRFSFEAALGATYCLILSPYNNWRPTAMPEQFMVDAHKYFEIGLYDTQLIFDPIDLASASVGEPYSQTVTITGGKPPYSLTGDVPVLPNGLTFEMSFDGSSFTISGTPTTLGTVYPHLTVKDADGITGRWFSSIKVGVEGIFTLASSANPSAIGEEVTFTFSGSGDLINPETNEPVLPYGTVSFLDGETLIPGCGDLILNFIMDEMTVGQYPVTCKTAALTEGPHTIKALFTDYSGVYHHANLTLTQAVGQTDTTPPVVSVTGVTAGAAYVRGSVPAAGCSTSDALSGVAVEASLTLSGGDAQGLGSFTATCSGAVDKAGNAAVPVSVQYTVITAADLSITVTDSKDPVKPRAGLVYTLTVSNSGLDPAQNLVVVDVLDRNTTYASTSAPKGWKCKFASGKVTCSSASLAGGSSAVIKITVTVSKNAKVGKDLVNNASVSSTTYDPNMLNNSAVQKTMVLK